MTNLCFVIDINQSVHARSFTSMHLYHQGCWERKESRQPRHIHKTTSVDIDFNPGPSQIQQHSTLMVRLVQHHTLFYFPIATKPIISDCRFLQMPPREKTSNLSYCCNVNESKTKFHHSPSCSAAGVKTGRAKKKC